MDVSFLLSAFNETQYPPPDKPEIAFAGRSNVGKSSLINVLVNRKKLARTSSRPGRTQSINFFNLSNKLYIVDLPGYGFAKVPLKIKKSWKTMIETYLHERSNLKGVVVILDVRRDPTPGDIDLLNWLKHYELDAIPVLTKADKLSRQKARTKAKTISNKFKDIAPLGVTLFSAKTRQGRDMIWEKINSIVKI